MKYLTSILYTVLMALLSHLEISKDFCLLNNMIVWEMTKFKHHNLLEITLENRSGIYMNHTLLYMRLVFILNKYLLNLCKSGSLYRINYLRQNLSREDVHFYLAVCKVAHNIFSTLILK